MLSISEIQKKILDYLKQRGSSNVNWSSIVQQFNLRKDRYGNSFIKQLKKWYEEQIFNRISFSLPKEIYKKRLTLCKRQGKRLIIKNYLKNREFSDGLLSWSKVKTKCLSGQYLSAYNQEEWVSKIGIYSCTKK